MSKADKILEEFGYEKSTFGNQIQYRYENDGWINYFILDLEYKQINLEMLDWADFKLIKAIYMKCKELGWK